MNTAPLTDTEVLATFEAPKMTDATRFAALRDAMRRTRAQMAEGTATLETFDALHLAAAYAGGPAETDAVDLADSLLEIPAVAEAFTARAEYRASVLHCGRFR